MFDTMKIASVIRQARIDKNMTQMQLADAMGVSYQAVSNWERGNSMPDISKLEDLCRALNITVEQLLGMETPAAAAVTKVMAQEELTVEELTEVAPVLEPKELKKQLKAEKKRKKLKLDAIADLAPFLGREELESLLADVELVDLDGLEDIAPFLGQDALGRLVDRLEVDTLEDIEDIAPFLSRETLGKVVSRCSGAGNFETIADLAPFLGREDLEALLADAEPVDLEGLEDIAPFLGQDALDRLVDRLEVEALEDIEDIAPFLSRETMGKVVARCGGAGKLETVADLAPFLGHEILDKLVDDLIEAEFDPEEQDLSDLYPFISREAAGRLAKYLLAQRELEAMEDLMPFV